MATFFVDTYKIKNLYSGLGQFSKHFAEELSRQISSEDSVQFLLPEKLELSIPSKEIFREKVWQRFFPFFNSNYNIWHSLHQFPVHFPNKKSRHILTVHDLNFLQEKEGAKLKKYQKRLQQNIDNAAYVTAISNFTKSELEKHIDLKGKPVTVIHNGIAKPSCETPQNPTGFDTNIDFFFSIGIFSEKKNFHVLLPLLKHFSNHKLVLAGNSNTHYGKKVKAEIKAAKLEKQVVLLGTITEEEKAWLYSECTAFLFPSYAEGFGMPPIEAMHYGKPVFLSKMGSLPEVGGENAFYFDDFEIEEMAKTITKGLEKYNSDKLLYTKSYQEHAASFSWENCIRKYLELYRVVLSK